MRPRVSIRGSVRPSVRLSVRYASWKIAFLCLFWPRWDRILDKTIDKHVLRSCFDGYVRNSSSLSVCSSICLSMYRTHSARNSIHAVTQSGRIVARSGLFFYRLLTISSFRVEFPCLFGNFGLFLAHLLDFLSLRRLQCNVPLSDCLLGSGPKGDEVL